MLDRMQRRRGEFRGGLRTSHTLPLPLASPAAGGPLLLLGVISGDAARRRFLRRAWVAQLNAGAVVRVRVRVRVRARVLYTAIITRHVLRS